MNTNEDRIQQIVRRIWTEFGTSFSPVELGMILDYLAHDTEVTQWLSVRNGDLRDRLFETLKDAEVFASIRMAMRLADVEFVGVMPDYVKEAVSKAAPLLKNHMTYRVPYKVPAPSLVLALETFQARNVVHSFQIGGSNG